MIKNSTSLTDSFYHKLFLVGAVLLALLGSALFGERALAEDNVYMFSYFKEPDGTDGLHLAYSLDGKNYHAVNGDLSILPPNSTLMRDPCVNDSGANGVFHLTFTTGWSGTSLGVSQSTDLINWSAPQTIPIMASTPNTEEVWAPENIWDPVNQNYVVYWSSKVGLSSDSNTRFKTWYSRTTDFNNFTTPTVLYDYGSDEIDANIVKNGSNYVMFMVGIKEAAGGTTVTGTYNTTNVPRITSFNNYYSEGPSATKIGNNWMVYYDHDNNHRYAATLSTDNMATWTDATDYVAFPDGARHGSVFTVPLSVAQNLAANSPNKPAEDEFVASAGTSDFHTASNWFAGSVPGANQTPVIENGHTVNITSSPSGTFSGLKVGITSIGVLNISNASVSVSSAWPNGLIIGGCIGANGTVVQSGASSVTANGFTSIGKLGKGSYTLQNGSLTATGDFNIGDIRGSQGDFYMNGGTLTVETMFIGSGFNDGISTGNAVGSVHQSGGSVTVTRSGDCAVIGGRSSAYAVGTYELSGGIFSTPIVKGGGGTSTFHFNGGTLKASSSSTSFMSGLTTADVKSGGAVIDTNGNNVTIPQALTTASASGGLTKNGAGILTLTAANTYSGPTSITQGTIKLDATPVPTVAHRWSFNNSSLADSVGDSNAKIVPAGATDVSLTSNTGQVTLTGGAGASPGYINLGTNLLPDTNTPVTIELWATQKTVKSWSRIFDLGSSDSENLFMSWTTGITPASDRVEWKDGVTNTSDNTNQPYSLNTEYHVVMELNPVGSSTVVTWYSAASGSANLGLAKGSFTTTNTLANFADSADNLGRSFYTNDSTANASYNEVRFWNGALSSNILEILHDAGPDANFNSLNLRSPGSLPSTTDVNITGSAATLDLNNFNQTVGSLSGVSGSSVLLGSGTLTIGGNTSTTFSGVISGSGGIIKNGSGILTLTGKPTYTGNTLINGGGLQLNTGTTTLAAILGQGNLIVDGAGITTQLTASSISVGTLTIAANSTVVISAIAGGPISEFASTRAVPEPGVWILLLIAAAAVCLKRR